MVVLVRTLNWVVWERKPPYMGTAVSIVGDPGEGTQSITGEGLLLDKSNVVMFLDRVVMATGWERGDKYNLLVAQAEHGWTVATGEDYT